MSYVGLSTFLKISHGILKAGFKTSIRPRYLPSYGVCKMSNVGRLPDILGCIQIRNMTTVLPEYEIRLMKKEEIPQVLDIWRENGLIEGVHSVYTWFEYDPQGFFVAATNDGTVLGVCAGILQHNSLAFMGLYAVKSTFQRKGIGKKIWDKVIDRVGDRNIGLNPVPALLENYRDKSGFPIQSEFRSVMYVAQQLLNSQMTTEIPEVNVRSLTPEDTDLLKAVSEFESTVLGFTRERLIPILCAEEDSVTVVASKVHDDSVCGYGSIRQNNIGIAHVGPLFADDHAIAELILYHLKKAFPVAGSEGIILTTVDCNEAAMTMIDKLGFHRYPGKARLYSKKEVDIQFRKVFALTSLNFSVV